MKLYAHQQRIVDKCPDRRLLAWRTGTGKSLTAIELALRHNQAFLVICPKHLVPKWERDLKGSPVLVTVISKETFRKGWDKLMEYPTIIVDEAHHFAGMKSAMSKSLFSYMKKHKTRYVYPLTATPYTSSPWSVYRLAEMCGMKWNYWTFFNKFFQQVRMGGRMVPVIRPNIKDDLAKLLHTFADVVTMEECIDVPMQSFETEFFKVNKDQEKGIADVSMKETNPVVKFTKIHQIINGSLKGDEYNEDRFFKTDKIERLLEIAEENKKVAVFCRYNLEIDAYKAAFEGAGKKVHIIRGDVKDRDAVVRQAEEDDCCVVLINAACSEGYELASIGVIVFSSLSFSFVHYSQAIGRFLRINRPKKNVYIHLVTEGTIDEDVYDCIMRKQDFDVAIYSKN